MPSLDKAAVGNSMKRHTHGQTTCVIFWHQTIPDCMRQQFEEYAYTKQQCGFLPPMQLISTGVQSPNGAGTPATLTRAMCVGSVGYYHMRTAAHCVRCLGMIVSWVHACFLLRHQRCTVDYLIMYTVNLYNYMYTNYCILEIY